jgi:hypothetical protein
VVASRARDGLYNRLLCRGGSRTSAAPQLESVEIQVAAVNKETFLLLRCRGGGQLRWLARTWAVPLSAVAHTPRVLFSSQLRGCNEKAGALAVLYRVRFWRFLDGHRLLMGTRR